MSPTPKRQGGQPPARSGWGTVGIVLACVVTIAGLAMLALVIVVFVYVASIGGNK